MKNLHKLDNKKMPAAFQFSCIVMPTAIFICLAQNYAAAGTGPLVKNIFQLDWCTWYATTSNADNIVMQDALSGDTVRLNIAIAITGNGVVVPYPGIAIGNAGSLNDRKNLLLPGAGPEFITATTNATGFHLLDLYCKSAANMNGYKPL